MKNSSLAPRLLSLVALTAAATLVSGGTASAAGSTGSLGSTGSSSSEAAGATGSSGSLGSLGSLGSTGTSETPPLTFDGWGTCPTDDAEVATCVTVLVRDGSIKIGGLTVPIPDGGMKIAGGIKYAFDEDNNFIQTFVPAPQTTYGVVSNPITIPGGALGIDTPLALTQITAEVEAVGNPTLDLFTFDFNLPVRLKLSNPLLGDSCYIGSPEDPVNFALRTPNQNGNPTEPIGTHPGAVYRDLPHADDTFAVPAANGCAGGLLDWAVNLRAGIPSPAGNNSIDTVTDIYNVAAMDV